MWEYAKCQEWLSSDACWRAQAEGNEMGIENVRLHAREHQAAMVAMMPPPMAQPPAKGKQPHGGAPEANKQVQQKSAPPGAPQQPTPQGTKKKQTRSMGYPSALFPHSPSYSSIALPRLPTLEGN